MFDEIMMIMIFYHIIFYHIRDSNNTFPLKNDIAQKSELLNNDLGTLMNLLICKNIF